MEQSPSTHNALGSIPICDTQGSTPKLLQSSQDGLFTSPFSVAVLPRLGFTGERQGSLPLSLSYHPPSWMRAIMIAKSFRGQLAVLGPNVLPPVTTVARDWGHSPCPVWLLIPEASVWLADSASCVASFPHLRPERCLPATPPDT